MLELNYSVVRCFLEAEATHKRTINTSEIGYIESLKVDFVNGNEANFGNSLPHPNQIPAHIVMKDGTAYYVASTHAHIIEWHKTGGARWL